MLNASLEQEGTDYVSLVEHFQSDFPTVNRHQIQVDMGRTFPDEHLFRSNKERAERQDTLQEQLGQEVLDAIQRICTAYSVRNSHIGYC